MRQKAAVAVVARGQATRLAQMRPHQKKAPPWQQAIKSREPTGAVSIRLSRQRATSKRVGNRFAHRLDLYA